MEATARDFNQNSSRILAAAEAGETVTVTKSGCPVAILRPYGADDVPAHPTGPMGDLELPSLGLPEIASRSGADKSIAAMRFVERYNATRRFEVPDIAPHLSTALAVMEGYRDAGQGRGVGLTDAVNVALAAAYRTDCVFTTDRHFRMMSPLTGHAAFRMLPDDL